MSYKLSKKDYVSILQHYNLNIPKSARLCKKRAEKIMSEKLCKCIKKLDPEKEARSIGICTKTIFNSKGFIRGEFKCKKGRTVKIRKKYNNNNNNKNKTYKNSSTR
jgi:hypothetical protein